MRLASKIRLWLDDERDPKDPKIQQQYKAVGNEIWVKTVEEALPYFQSGNVEYISFDNDLGEGNTEGKKLAEWIEEQAYYKKIPRIQWMVHSQNPAAAKEILRAMQSADRFWEDNN